MDGRESELPTQGRRSEPRSRSLQKLVLVSLVLLSLALSGVAIARSGNPYGTLEGMYTDHLRHQRYAEEFLRSGLRLYVEPAGVLQRLGGEDDRTYIWPQVSYPYPFGTILVHLPAAILTYHLGVDPVLVNRLLVFAYVALAHACVLIFAWDLLLTPDRGNRFIGLGVAAAFWLSLLLWSLNGQFEPLPILLVLLASRSCRRQRFGAAMALLGAAMLVKYQAVIYAPLAAAALWQRAIPRWQAVFLNPGATVLVTAIGLDVLTFGLGYRDTQMPDNNVISYAALLSGQLSPNGMRLVIALAMTAVLSAHLTMRRAWPLALNVAFAAVLLATLPQIQGWYMLWLYPLAMFAQGTRRDSVGFWTLALAYLLGQLPDPTYIGTMIAARL